MPIKVANNSKHHRTITENWGHACHGDHSPSVCFGSFFSFIGLLRFTVRDLYHEVRDLQPIPLKIITSCLDTLCPVDRKILDHILKLVLWNFTEDLLCCSLNLWNVAEHSAPES